MTTTEGDPKLSAAVARLREELVAMRKTPVHSQIVDPQEQVYARFQPMFSPAYIPRLTEEEFRPFLYFENNHHWTGLHRQVNKLCADMAALRASLLVLLDENRPIEDRLDELAETAPTGFGKGTMSAILHVAHPRKYGVWNGTTDGALTSLGIYPEFPRGASFGKRYAQVNALLNRIADALEVNLWTLDALWWMLEKKGELPYSVRNRDGAEAIAAATTAQVSEAVFAAVQAFGLERHLHDFLMDNWDRLPIGHEWAVYSQPGEPQLGYEFACAVGRIDILSRHRREKKWLVVELKREDTSDSVVGQVLRYMGWVQQHLAEPGDEVRGLVVARVPDEALQYAISLVPTLAFQVYEVEFRLKDPPPLPPRTK